jgi:hypothetical protein
VRVAFETPAIDSIPIASKHRFRHPEHLLPKRLTPPIPTSSQVTATRVHFFRKRNQPAFLSLFLHALATPGSAFNCYSPTRTAITISD